MLRFHKASFRNFVLLRDVELEFADSIDQSVTVIRASNGSGKTTCLRGMQWALYGDAALPSRGKYDIQPIDWTANDGPVEIKVELEFSVSHTQRRPGAEPVEVVERYTLTRKAEVRPADNGDPKCFTQPSPILMRQEDAGFVPVSEPQSLINGWLPMSLREFFFTDGDEALAYISADESSARRGKVEGAVKALLGLDLVDAAEKRVGEKTASHFRREAARESGEVELEQLENEIERKRESLTDREEERDVLLGDLDLHESNVAKHRSDRDKALERGNKETLTAEKVLASTARTNARENRRNAQNEISKLLRHPGLEAALLKDRLESVRDLLEPLQKSGRIPASHVPFLRDRLHAGTCVCGADLDSDHTARNHLEHVISQSEQDSQASSRLSEIYTESGDMLRRVDQHDWHWPTLLSKEIRTEATFEGLEKEAGRKVAALEDTIAALPDTDIQTLTKALNDADAAAREVQGKISHLDVDITELATQLSDLKDEAEKKASKVGKAKSWRAAEIVANDVSKVLAAALETLKHEKVREVSERMDALFREMIVADAETAIIRRAILTSDYDILVHGPGDRILNPDTELNGASRRALTISFILALAEISGVAAPNVIDTPLGMTSGATRRQVFKVAARDSGQLILFLTRDEIRGIEDLLSESVGSSLTLTAMAHFPTQVVNRTSPQNEALVCECSIDQYCSICERIGDEENPELSRRP